MANIKIAISLQESLVDQVDDLAREIRVSRSRLFVLALEDYVRRSQNLQLLEEINHAYRDPPDALEKERLQNARRHHRKIVEGRW